MKISIKSFSYINCARNLRDLVDCRLKDGNLKDRTVAWKQGPDDSQLGVKGFSNGEIAGSLRNI